MKWCEHTKPGKVFEIPNWLNPRVIHAGDWNFCPICGTPRPQEKSLEQKFKEFLDSEGCELMLKTNPRVLHDEDYILRIIKQIAEEHFAH